MSTPSAPSPVLRLLAVGNAGLAMLEAVGDRLPGVDAIAINTDDPALTTARAHHKISLERRALAGLGTGGDPELGRELATEHAARIRAACEGADAVLLLTGLGRGTGSGAAPVAAEAARAAGALVIAVAALPFAFEGVRRERQAQRALDRLGEFAHGVITWPNESVFQLISETRPVADVLREVNARIAEGVAGLGRLLTRPGLLAVHLPDVASLLRQAPARAVLASVAADGPERAAVVVEKLLAHPLLREGEAFTGCGAVLVGLAAGRELTMAEVKVVMGVLNERCGEAQMFVSATEDAALDGNLQLTVIVAHPATPTEPSVSGARSVRSPARAEAPPELGGDFLDPHATPTTRGLSAFRPPAPELPPERVQQLASRRGGRSRKGLPRMRQEQLPLQLVSKGRFDSVEPTVLDGQDLDVPTFVRRNMVFN
ncbi:MAG: hypothetical protein ACK45B_11415 [Limisphaerales bacterium]